MVDKSACYAPPADGYDMLLANGRSWHAGTHGYVVWFHYSMNYIGVQVFFEIFIVDYLYQLDPDISWTLTSAGP